MEILDSIWFGTIGIVKTRTDYDGIRFYIGKGQGFNKKEDEEWIADWGYTLNPNDPMFRKDE
jgi:hypothetical protein